MRTDLPTEGGPAGYVGSQACLKCHEDQYHSWHRTYHRTMTQYPGEHSIQADFSNVVLTNENARFTLYKRTNEFWVRMEPHDATTAGSGVDAPIGLVTGSHHMQVFWVASGEGNTQIGFPFTWLIPEKRWVPRNSAFIRPPDAVHRSEIWNVVCSRCHATAIEPRVDPAARTVDSRAAELGISCEACHGPGLKHTETRTREAASGIKPTAETLKGEVVHPEKLDAARSAQVCGFCHSMKWIDRSEAWRAHGFRFRPGDDLNETTPIIRPGKTDSVPGLSAFLERNPGLLEDFFWPDGMIRVSGREYNGLIESPCAKGGAFSCLSCHSLHDSDPDDLLARTKTGNGACLPCHEKYRDSAALSAHTRHRPASTGSECYNCHMPHTTYGVLKAIRSHQVSSPSIASEIASGRPNACNLCHLDRGIPWTAAKLAEWYGQTTPALPTRMATETSHAAQLALTGDAGQRVLVAWHLGWEPARKASGESWIAPLLGLLMDDPYAAVRCVADRSLIALGGPRPNGYDFVPDPSARPAAMPAVWQEWRRRLGQQDVPSTTLTLPGSLDAQTQLYQDWLRRRDNRPIRLRE